MVAHIFDAEDAVEAVELYHNVPLQDLDRVSVELLFARMAWTVFPHLSMFLSARMKRKVLQIGPNNEWQAQELSGDQCFRLYGQTPKCRSSSPRKRTAIQATELGGQLHEEYVEHEEEGDAYWQRGRKRMRGSHDSSPDSFGSPSSGELLKSGSEASESADLRSLQTE